MTKGIGIFLVILLVFQVCVDAAQFSKIKNSDKYDGGSYSNETRASAGTSHLDRIFTPKVFPHTPSERSGIGIAKGPPDLQFGLAFTVPFVSLSTERLLNQVSQHRGYDSLWDLANVLKLNVGGLVVVAIVGVAALLFIPAILPKFGFGSLVNGGFGGIGGGWPSNGFGGFFPGFLEQLVPGLGLNKPLGYGQTYDPNTYSYNSNSDYYGAGSQRSESESKSRALKDDPAAQNGTRGNFWSQVFREVRNTAAEFETCALFAMCERGRNFTLELANRTASRPQQKGRNGRAQDGGGSQSQDDPTHVSRFEDIFGAMARGFGEELPGLVHMQKAFEAGKEGKDCSKYSTKCPLTTLPIQKVVQNVGDYIFN